MFRRLATIAVGAPTVANPDTFGICIGGDRDMHRHYRNHDLRGSRAEYYGHDRGLHVAGIKIVDRTVIIKKRRHWDD